MNAQPDVANLAFTPHKHEHGRRRRIIAQGFSDAAIRDAEPIMMGHIRMFCETLLTDPDTSSEGAKSDASWTKPKDLTDLSMCHAETQLHWLT